MNATRVRDLVVVGLVVAVVANLLVRLTYSSLPDLPLAAGATLGVLGIAEFVAGNMLRARIERRPGSLPVQPLVAARAVLVAKASALGGAVVAGLWAGLLSYVLPLSADVVAASSDAVASTVGLVCALALVAGALWLERCCRTPDEPDRSRGRDRDRPDSDGPSGRAGG